MDLAKQVCVQPTPREMDVLLATGEQVSVALLAMALNEIGVPARSFTGGQVKEGQGPQSGYRMMAAVAEGPGGNIFIRFVGPEKTVAAGQAKYEQLLASIQRE